VFIKKARKKESVSDWMGLRNPNKQTNKQSVGSLSILMFLTPLAEVTP